jgi:hypothetical protein
VPYRHAKMVAFSYPSLTDVMTERPCELLHMDLVGPARVRSTLGMCGCSFLRRKGRHLVLLEILS